MTSPVYLLFLCAALGCMVLLDWRGKLAFWRAPGRAAVCLGGGVALLLVTDLVGIALGVFHRGTTWAMTGILLAPELPLEEPIFLAFLSYLTLVLLGIADRVRAGTRQRTDEREPATRAVPEVTP